MSFLDWFSGLTGQMSADMAIDLGTANTLVAITGEGIVINEPSVVAIEKSTQRVLAVGHEAKNMINHTPDAFSAEHPLKDGVIADYDVTEAMISAFINKAAERKYPWQPKPRIVVCIPCGATSVEKRAVFEATIQAGARQAYLIEEPMAAAMGADLPVTEPTGSMVVDIGGGTTEVAVISLGGIVTSSSLRLAGNRLDEAIAMHLRDLLGIKIGERTAEVIKIKIGSILPFEDGRERDMIISGQDVYTEQPKEVTIQSEDVRAALQAPIEEMVLHIKDTFKKTNPDLASDIIQNGILLTGGGGLLSGLDRYLTDKLEIPVWVSETALTNVVSGCLKVLEDADGPQADAHALEVGLSLPMALNFQQHEPASAGRLSLIIALAVSLVCVGLYQAEGATGPLHSLQSAVEGAMVPLQRASAPLTEAVDDAGAAAAEGGVTEETYATLRQQNEQLVQQLAAAEEQRLEERAAARPSEPARHLRDHRRVRPRHRADHRRVEPDGDPGRRIELRRGNGAHRARSHGRRGPGHLRGRRLVPGAPAHRSAVRGGRHGAVEPGRGHRARLHGRPALSGEHRRGRERAGG